MDSEQPSVSGKNKFATTILLFLKMFSKEIPKARTE